MKFKIRNGKPLTLSNIYISLRNTFYYGTFEYPKGGGQWYTGKHIPIINKELFDKTQESIVEHVIKTESKEFAFTKLITCGLCGSGITADEKFKKQKNGNVHRYVYYGCCRFQDRNCKSGYMREEDLIEQLASLMDKINMDEVGMKEKIKTEVEKFKKFQRVLLNIKNRIEIGDINIRNYAKYILKEGTITEKREFLRCLKTKILMSNGTIYISCKKQE